MSLKDWLNSGWIIDHQTSPKELADFISLAERDLKNYTVPGLDPEW